MNIFACKAWYNRKRWYVPLFLALLAIVVAACGTSTTRSDAPSAEPVAEEEISSATVPEEASTELDTGANASSEPVVSEEVSSDTSSIPPIPDTIDLDTVPQVDQTQHTVPLEEIYFDTFQRVNRVVPLSQADDALILRLRDAIPPIYTPNFVSAAEAEDWLADTDLVLGYADGDEAYVYPIKIMNWHEIVSHKVNGKPILATY